MYYVYFLFFILYVDMFIDRYVITYNLVIKFFDYLIFIL